MSAERQRTVEGGVLKRLSVSQVAQFDPAAGGCPRKWWFQRVARREEPPSRFQELGTALHAEVEKYQKTGDAGALGPVTQAAASLLPPPRHPLVLSEVPFGGAALSSRGVPGVSRLL